MRRDQQLLPRYIACFTCPSHAPNAIIPIAHASGQHSDGVRAIRLVAGLRNGIRLAHSHDQPSPRTFETDPKFGYGEPQKWHFTFPAWVYTLELFALP
jgi:hypothetical protein